MLVGVLLNFFNMKKAFVAVLALVVMMLSAGTVNAQSGKGLEVQWKISAAQLGNEKVDMNYRLKGDHALLNMDMGAMGAMKVFVDKQSHKVTTIIPSMNMAMEMDMPDDQAVAEKSKNFDIKATGKKETVNGYKAEEYMATLENGSVMTMWLTPDLPKSFLDGMKGSMNFPGQSDKMGPAMKKIFEKGLMFVRMSVAKEGQNEMTMDLVKFEEKNLDDSIFEIPKGIKVQHVDPAAMKGMRGGMGGH